MMTAGSTRGPVPTKAIDRATRRRRRHLRCSSVLALAGSLALGLGCGDEPSASNPAASRTSSTTRVTDLLGRGSVDAPRIRVEEFDGDFRAAWVAPLAARFSASFSLAADGCEFVTGVRANGDGAGAGAPVVVRVSKLDAAGDEVIFEATMVSGPRGKAVWRDGGVPLPGREGELATLSFSAERTDTGSPDGITISWSTPHVVCRSLPVVRHDPPRRPHLVFVSIDTLRADHMSLYGYRRKTTPFLDRFAESSVVFEQAFSTAPWTAPSHASMFTGLYPEQHRAGHADPFAPLPDDVETMATILRRAGYRTIAFTAGGVMAPESGLAQGFDRYESRARASLQSYAPAILEEVERFASEPMFLFLHTYDVHGPFIQPRGKRAFRADIEDPRISEAEWARLRSPGPHDYHRLERFSGLHDVVAAYDSGIRYVDRELEMLFGQLRNAGVLDNALVIVTSDHGEVLYDRELYIGHTYTLHDEVLHVPLIVRRIGQRRGERRDELTDGTDLLPMVLEELELDRPPGLAGLNPLRDRRSDEIEKSFVRGEAAHTGASFIRTKQRKVITDLRGFDDPQNRLPGPLRDRVERGTTWYDMIADAGERSNLYAPHDPSKEPYLRLQGKLRRELEASLDREATDARELNPAELEELRALGYAE